MNVNLMPRFPNISEYENVVKEGRKLCRNCEKQVAMGRRHYCSDYCMQTFLVNHQWHWVRKSILRRDNYRCSICEKRCKKSQLDVDHIIPVRMGIDPFDKNNLRILCKECHKSKTKLDREANL